MNDYKSGMCVTPVYLCSNCINPKFSFQPGDFCGNYKHCLHSLELADPIVAINSEFMEELHKATTHQSFIMSLHRLFVFYNQLNIRNAGVRSSWRALRALRVQFIKDLKDCVNQTFQMDDNIFFEMKRQELRCFEKTVHLTKALIAHVFKNLKIKHICRLSSIYVSPIPENNNCCLVRALEARYGVMLLTAFRSIHPTDPSNFEGFEIDTYLNDSVINPVHFHT